MRTRPLSARLTAALAAALITLAGLAGAAHAARVPATATATRPPTAPAVTPATPVTAGSGYVALGDSVTFGYQEASVVPAPNFHDAASFLGYPEQLGTALHLRVANFACPGETSASLIDPRAPTFGCEGAYRALYPLHVGYRGGQLAAAVAYLKHHPGVRLVSLMIGANDLFRCQATTSDNCGSELRVALAAVGRNVRHILTAVRDQAGYRGQLVIVNYYALDYALATVRGFSQALNRTQDSAARPFHVRIADGYGRFRQAAIRFGSHPCLAGLLTQTGAYGTCGVHPSDAGQALLAAAVTAAIRL